MLGLEIGTNSLVTDPLSQESRLRLDGLVVNIELTLTSIIQGVALYFLTDNARVPLSQLRFEYWIYVANGLILLFLFWSRSVVHTLTVIRWPIQFSHNFLYIACTLVEAIAFTQVQEPLLWYLFNAVFALVALILFIVDSRMIAQQQVRITELRSRIMSDQRKNIWLLMPAFVLYPLVVALLIWRGRTFFSRSVYTLFLGSSNFWPYWPI